MLKLEPNCQKKKRDNAKKSSSTESQPTPKSNSVHSAKETIFLGIEEHSSHLAGPTTSTIDEWLVESGVTVHMTYDKSILHYVKPCSSQISMGEDDTLPCPLSLLATISSYMDTYIVLGLHANIAR